MTWIEQTWYRRGLRNGWLDADQRRGFTVTALGGCEAYARGYELGKALRERGEPQPE